MAAFCAPARSAKSERHSPASAHASGTTFVAQPPEIVPMLAVVASSMRPSGIAPTAAAAMAMADAPFSGSTPACAARPEKRALSAQWHGAPTMTVPGAPSASST